MRRVQHDGREGVPLIAKAVAGGARIGRSVYRSRALLWLIRLAIVAAVLAPAFYWRGGLVEIETTQFIRQYLDSRPLLQKIFDPRANDFGAYQARELSYLVDFLDATVFRELFSRGVVLFVPLSALVASVATTLVFYAGWRRTFPSVGEATAGLIVLVYLTNYTAVVTGGMFYRSAKPVLVPVLLGMLFYLYRCSRPTDPLRDFPPPDSERTHRRMLKMCLFTAAVGLLDRQGFFYSIAAAAWTALRAVSRRRDVDLFLGAVGGITITTVYNLFLAPLATSALNGYWPDFAYQRLSVSELISRERLFWSAGSLLVESAHVLFGSWPWWGYLAAGAAIWRMTSSRTVKDQQTNRGGTSGKSIAVAGLVFVLAGHVLMFALMILRHPPVFEWRDHRLWYYPIAFQITATFCLLAAVNRCLVRGCAAGIVNLALVLMIATNVAHWANYRKAMLLSRWFPIVHEQSEVLKRSLHEGRAHHSLNLEYGVFYEYLKTRGFEDRVRR